ncbi:MAG: single-stranded DNA-binding protein [Thermoprotei archaeon]
MSKSESIIRIIDLKPNLENIHVKGRVLEASPPRIIQTRKGARTISNALIGDESGRVELTLWGMKAGTIKKGEVIEIIGAWTSVFKGRVQLNAGKSSTINKLDDSEAPAEENIPEDMPKAPYTPRKFGPRSSGGQRRFRNRRFK